MIGGTRRFGRFLPCLRQDGCEYLEDVKHARPHHRLGRHSGGDRTLADLATARRFGLKIDAELAPHGYFYRRGLELVRVGGRCA